MEAVAREIDLYKESFAAFEEMRQGEALWLQKLRREAFARFQELGFPTPKTEAWKYTGVAAIARTAFQLANEFSGPPKGRGGDLPRPAGARLVFVNGRYRRDLTGLPQGIRALSLREALASRPEGLEPHLARHADFHKQAFAAWNTAFFEDGAFLDVARGAVVDEPIEICFLSEPGKNPAVSHPRNLIVVGSDSRVSFIERYTGAGGTYLTNAITELLIGDGAVIEHYKIQREALSAYHVHTLQVRQERSSSFVSHNIALGSALARTDINTLFSGEGGECALNGLFVGEDSQHLDTHTFIDHAKPHCSSRELYKGILDGKARGVFHGTILVRPGAQKTDAMQTNKNLLLSKEALVDSTPALEIFADDVKCKHGSTIGQLDASALFYLRSRGIGEEEARSILTYAFASDVANRIRVPTIRAEVEDMLGLRFATPSLPPQEVLS